MPAPGQIRDCNRIMLLSVLNQQGYKTIDLGIVPDEPCQLEGTLSRAISKGMHESSLQLWICRN